MVHRVSCFPHAYHYLLFVVFLIIDNLTGVRWYLITVLVYIYLMIKDVSIFYLHIGHQYVFIKISMRFLCSILIELFVFFLFWFDVEFYEIFVYFKYWVLVRYIVNIFSSISVLSSFLMVFLFTMQKVFSLMWGENHSVVYNSSWPHGLYSPCNSPGQNTGVGNLSLLQV